MVIERPGAGSTTRRTILSRSAAGIAAGAAFALTGCGARAGRLSVHTIPAEARSTDVEILGGLLDRKYKAIAAYTAGIPLLAGKVQTNAKQILSQEVTHSDELYGLIRQAKGAGNRPQPSYPLGHPRTRAEVLELLHTLEQEQIAAYLDAIPSVSPGSVRAVLASILANDAQHVVLLRRGLRVDPLPEPFPTGSDSA